MKWLKYLIIAMLITNIYALANESELVDSSKSNYSELVTLEDYINLATERNPGVMAAYENYQAKFEKTGYAGALPDPKISYGYFIDEVETRVGPQKQKFSLKQSIPWFGSLGDKKAIAKSAAKIEFQKYSSAILKLSFEIKINYFKLYELQHQESILYENRELLQFWVNLINTKYELGERSHSDLLQAQIEFKKIDDELLSLQSKIEPVRVKLRALLNIDPKISLSTDTDLSFDSIQLDKHTLTEALSANPYLTQYESIIEMQKENLNLAAKESYPGFTLGVDYILTDDSPIAGLNENGKDPLIISVGLNLPLWFGKNKAKKKEATANLRSARYSYLDKLNQTEAELIAELANFENIKRKHLLYHQDIIPQSKYNLELLFKSYQLGQSSIYDLISVERELLRYQLFLEELKLAGFVSLAKIELLSNIELL